MLVVSYLIAYIHCKYNLKKEIVKTESKRMQLRMIVFHFLLTIRFLIKREDTILPLQFFRVAIHGLI